MLRQLAVTLSCGIILALTACQPVSGPQQATLYRDTYGVPHIYAESETAAAFVHGYAQAEDRLEQLLSNYRWAEGTLAEALGKDYLDSDYNARAARHAEVSRNNYQEIPASTRAQCEAFIDGVKTYMKEHPDKVPEWAPEIHPWHVVAMARAFIWGWPAGQAMDDLRRRRPVDKPRTRGSNQWVLAGSRTASGAPIALIDPHLSWDAAGHWTEVRIHAGDLHTAGMVIVGTPYPALGHNRNISWAATTGGPDCGDIYVEETDPENPLRYRYDGEWRTMTVDSVRLGYRENDTVKYETRAIERSHHGPIVKREGNKAYAMAIPYADEVLLVESLYRINKARSVDEARAALAMQQFLPQNMMIADVHGDLYYERTGRVPIRPQGYDFDYPVPGNTSKSEWQGLHPTSDLVHILNPPAGYMQNCNISPGTMIHTGAPREQEYPEYIYNDSQNRANPRGRRAVALLKEAENVDVQTAMQFAFDVTADAYDITLWQRALAAAFTKPDAGGDDALSPAVDLITGWDHSFAADNETAPLFVTWRRLVREKHVDAAEIRKDPVQLSAATRTALLDALSEAVSHMQETYGGIRVAWGKTLRLRRGDKDLPLGGAGHGRLGLSTLRNVWARDEDENGVSVAAGGQSCPMLVVLKNPIESYSILPWGISDDPESPHYDDQMELFSQRRMKPVWFNRDELKSHIASEREFTVSLTEK